METKRKTGTVDDVRRKLQPVVEGITERLNDPTVRDLTGYGVRFCDYNTSGERYGIVTAMKFELFRARWVCFIKEVPSERTARVAYSSVEVVLSAQEVAKENEYLDFK
jgi:hypothetical protein